MDNIRGAFQLLQADETLSGAGLQWVVKINYCFTGSL